MYNFEYSPVVPSSATMPVMSNTQREIICSNVPVSPGRNELPILAFAREIEHPVENRRERKLKTFRKRVKKKLDRIIKIQGGEAHWYNEALRGMSIPPLLEDYNSMVRRVCLNLFSGSSTLLGRLTFFRQECQRVLLLQDSRDVDKALKWAALMHICKCLDLITLHYNSIIRQGPYRILSCA